jgi:uncharacterized iron-regulated membrane protein
MPFLMLLSVTGAVYLSNEEIEAWYFASTLYVEPLDTPPCSPSTIIAAVQKSIPNAQLLEYTTPASPRHAACCVLQVEGKALSVYVNPYTATILGTINPETRLMPLVTQIHSLAILGTFANGVIEAVAGCTLLLIVTGVYLSWPRQGFAKIWRLRGTARQRTFWRDLHAITGISTMAIIGFLVITGLPWTGFWGSQLARMTRALDRGMPTAVWEEFPQSKIEPEFGNPSSWTQSTGEVPGSRSEQAPEVIHFDKAIAIAEAQGILPGFTITAPVNTTGVYTARLVPADPRGQRVIHIDQYNGNVLADVSFADYGTVAKGIEWGVSAHMGNAFGRLNQGVMLLGCIGVQFLCFTAAVIWWKRRPSGRIAPPPVPANPRTLRVVTGIVIIMTLIFPYTAIAIFAIAIFDGGVLLASRSV